MLAKALPLALVLAAISSAHAVTSQERFCQEERVRTERWVYWAADERQKCVRRNRDAIQRVVCLREARENISQVQREHAQVYRTQIDTLDDEHPVVRAMINRLNSNAQAARQIIDTGRDPASLVARASQACLASQ